jgi:phosphoglycerate dehydrogenase-like enzyme
MGEYVVANIVNHERNLMAVYENQQSSLWNTDGKISKHRTIADLTIGILGAGTIGTHSE